MKSIALVAALYCSIKLLVYFIAYAKTGKESEFTLETILTCIFWGAFHWL